MKFIQIFIAPLTYRLYIVSLVGYLASENMPRRRNWTRSVLYPEDRWMSFNLNPL